MFHSFLPSLLYDLIGYDRRHGGESFPCYLFITLCDDTNWQLNLIFSAMTRLGVIYAKLRYLRLSLTRLRVTQTRFEPIEG